MRTIDGIEVKINKLPFPFTLFAVGMAWRGEVYLKDPLRASDRLVRHEMIHALQQRELGWWKFLWKYIVLWFKHGYESHPMEEDAREWEFDKDFNTERPYKNWRKYL